MDANTKDAVVYPGLIPAIAVRDVVMFPHMALPLSVDRPKSVGAVEAALKESKYILSLAQKKPQVNDPAPDDLYLYGVVSAVAQSLKMPDGSMRVFLEGKKRARVKSLITDKEKNCLMAEVEYVDEPVRKSPEITALMRHAVEIFETYVKLNTRITLDSVALLQQVEDPSKLADTIAANSIFNIEDRQAVLETEDPKDRLEKLIKLLAEEIEILDIEHKIHDRVKTQIDKSQKEYYLNEQLKAIQKELHQKDDFTRELDEIRKKLNAAKMPKEAEHAAEKELNRLSHMMPFSPESTVSRTYLDWLVELPWNVETKDSLDLVSAKKILDEDHFGLSKPKERVLEYLAVTTLTRKLKGPILCFVGPPGVGKTSIARSIARAMGRNFVRMSLGGVRDEAEIRGHRRTYVASMPGRIIQSLKKAKSRNPVFLMDEIDKMGMDWRGDPAAALLEALDPEQNPEFMDHFLDVPFDISKVLFITTANTLWGIPISLRDRMEVIEFGGYTHNEKIQIANKFLVPKQMKEHGLKENLLRLSDETLDAVIRGYTREAGVRNLEREIASMSRRVARKVVEQKLDIVKVTPQNLGDFLGIPKFLRQSVSHNAVGIATGLAWTENGGEILAVEAVAVPGKGDLILTGKLGDIMKESAQAAFSYVRSRESSLNSFVTSHNFHVHIPEGAIPKDGPSAGITIAIVLASLISGRVVKQALSMTGEITLSGRVLPVGGLKEKIIASFRDEIFTVLFPKDNMKDLEEIPEEIRAKMKLIGVSSIEEALALALEPKKTARSSKTVKSR
ncbi:MAG: endopeptidase La [Elusimicrobia bacterium GWF2_52_66]|nr:MAG: endopeptidase La [Elusimicrobia bacterium GWA2_51_34]OGR87335.1 MAG: endopeptidase La [Elusimicrobia bacterium GWF2_52_66]HAF94921.1 endopeptidase La [Elusimicrobiota bacterium]HCE97505.1 endopeptidase La [Elusimicrobiota bacterium]